jgi:hypothetical protein
LFNDGSKEDLMNVLGKKVQTHVDH